MVVVVLVVGGKLCLGGWGCEGGAQEGANSGVGVPQIYRPYAPHRTPHVTMTVDRLGCAPPPHHRMHTHSSG